MNSEFTWTDAAVATLRRLWSEGRPAAQIGLLLGVSKNSVIGKARRIELDGRPSPVLRPADGAARPKAVRRVRDKPTLPPLPTVRAERPVIAAPPPRPPEPPRLARGGGLCSWPIGEPRTPGFRYCDAPDVVAGRSYCAEHCSRAYLKPAPRTGEPVAFTMNNWGSGIPLGVIR